MKHKEKLKKLKKKVDDNLASDVEYRMYKYLSRLSGMKGAEKSLKDKLGKDINSAETTTDIANKVFDRIDKKRKEHYDS